MKSSPTLKLAIGLWLTAMGVTGFPAAILSMIALAILGSLADRGIIALDVKIDKIREAMKDPKWRDTATALYSKAMQGKKTEKEKNEIREQYLDALGDYASLADRLRDK